MHRPTACTNASFARWAWLCLMLCNAGCSDQGRHTASTTSPAAEKSAPREAVLRTTWDAYYVQGAKAGWIRSTVSEIGEGSDRMIRTHQLLRLKILRAGAPFEATLEASCLERPDGEVTKFDASIPLGNTPLLLRGGVNGEEIVGQRVDGGKIEKFSQPLPRGTRGFMGVEQSLLAQPLQPGQRRTIVQLHLPPHGIVETVELEAADYEVVELLFGSFQLLKVRQSATLAGGAPIVTTLWTNREGEVLKSYASAGKIETYRTIQSVAESDNGAARVDVAFDINVPLDRPLPQGLQTARAVYEVTMDEGDPTSMFPAGAAQTATAQGEHTTRLAVTAIRPTSGSPSAGPADARYLAPNSLVQSDDPRILAMAREAAPAEASGWELAVALEKFVKQTIEIKDYSQAFSSAAEVAVSRQGDCTEHAVLLAALCRARGIPARAAMGLVYQASGPHFAYHMWTEAYVGGVWIPLDATLGRGGIGATHLKLADSDLGGASAYSSFLPVLEVMGRLKIHLIEAE